MCTVNSLSHISRWSLYTDTRHLTQKSEYMVKWEWYKNDKCGDKCRRRDLAVISWEIQPASFYVIWMRCFTILYIYIWLILQFTSHVWIKRTQHGDSGSHGYKKMPIRWEMRTELRQNNINSSWVVGPRN